MRHKLHRRRGGRAEPDRATRDRQDRAATCGSHIADEEHAPWQAEPGAAAHHDTSAGEGDSGPGARSGSTAVAWGAGRLNVHTIWPLLRRARADFKSNELTDRAAALTYYGILSLFPALLVLVSVLSVAGKEVAVQVVADIRLLVPGSAENTITNAVEHLQAHTATGSAVAILSLLVATWTASSYVAAFIRSANATYGMPEGRPTSRVLLVRLGVTVALMVLACGSAVLVVFTGDVARHAGETLGVGHTAMKAWSIAKWPALVLLVTIMIAMLYRLTPNVHVRARWITAGSCLALLIWMAVSGGFAFYVAHFASYNRTYGTLAGAVVFLVWLWVSNVAILLGLTFDAELARQRDEAAAPGAAMSAPPRSTRTWSAKDHRPWRHRHRQHTK
ncbi:YihY/virulence factor BrkB family protein [Streptomyces odontomachi]|uniref:YihY/virulence factor BrkB family protein n=1 Tax=Streptomyces odontomachi TaxID=2944940 RepID=UPI00210C57A4|nr:YihY/virulence factor BrkB family protein [Streptomyces sp. ODS25]